MQSFSKEEYEQQLPRCAACLQDFDLYQYPCQFVCRHIYCTQCLQRLKESSDGYKCIYDDTVTPVLTVKSDIGFYNRIDYFRRFVIARTDTQQTLGEQLAQLKKEVNYTSVACKNLLETSFCSLAVKCPYDHSLKSLAIARKYRVQEGDPCWDCRNCQLTVSRKLMKCPVCECEQDTPRSPQIVYSPIFRASNRRNVRKGTNATLDLSALAEDDRHKVKAGESDQSSAMPQVLENSTQRLNGNDHLEVSDGLPVEIKSSRCCVLQ